MSKRARGKKVEQVDTARQNRELIAQLEINEARQRKATVEIQKQTPTPPKTPSVPGIKPTKPTKPSPQRVTLIKPFTKTAVLAAAPSRRKVTTIVDIANKLTQDAGFVQKTSLAQKPIKPTRKQLKARLGLAIIEPIIGGVQEATLGLIGPQQRPATSVLRIAGAVATPTAADMAAGWIFARAGATALGRRTLKKMEKFLLNIGDPIFPKLTPAQLDEVRQWEKMGGGLTHLQRTAKKAPGILKTVDQISDFYKKNPAQFSAGASFIPEEVFIFQKFAEKYDFEIDELILFINKNDDLFSDGTIINGLIGVLKPSDAKKVIGATTKLPKDVIDDLVETRRTFKPGLDVTPVPIPAPPTEETRPDTGIEVGTGTGETEVTQEAALDQAVETITKQIKTTSFDEELLEEPTLNEVTPSFNLKLKEKDELVRGKLNLRLFRGRKSLFRVTFFFSRSTTEIKTVEARSFGEAMNKAQRRRKPRKKQPRLVDLVKLN